MVLLVYTHHLIPMNEVPFPSGKSEVGICLLKYAYCLSSTYETTLSESFLDKDGHEGVISDFSLLCANLAVLN